MTSGIVSRRLGRCATLAPGACALLAAVLLAASPAAAQRTEPLPKELEGVGITEIPGARIPLALEFLDESGATVHLSDYFGRGRPVILTLNYYRCPMLCGLMLNGLTGGLSSSPGRPVSSSTSSP